MYLFFSHIFELQNSLSYLVSSLMGSLTWVVNLLEHRYSIVISDVMCACVCAFLVGIFFGNGYKLLLYKMLICFQFAIGIFG